MARKIKAKLIMELRNQGMSRRAIPKTRHMFMSNVYEEFDLAEKCGITWDQVRGIDDAQVYGLLVIDEWLTEDVDDIAIRFLFELIERRYMSHSTVLCTQYTPAEWHGRLGGGVQADAMVDRLIHGSVRIDLGDLNIYKMVPNRK